MTQGEFNHRLCARSWCIHNGYTTSTCRFEIDVVIGPGFAVAGVAVFWYMLTGFDGSPTSKFIHRRLYLDDPNPPPNCICKE